MKKLTTALVVAIISIPMIVPLAASAQTTTSSNASLIAILTQLVQVLEQELQQLITARQSPPPSTHLVQPFFAEQISPLAIEVGVTTQIALTNTAIDFGDGSPLASLNGYCDANSCGIHHTYVVPGTYTVRLVAAFCAESGSCTSAGNVLAATAVTVTGSNPAQPSATIDQSLLTTTSAIPVISGTASNTSIVNVLVTMNGQIYSMNSEQVANGVWRDLVSNGLNGEVVPQLPAGSYNVQIFDGNNVLLTSGTLTVIGGNLN